MGRQTAPDADPALDAPAPDAPDSPQDQVGDAAAPPATPNKPARTDDPALLQREYTKSQQRWADLRKGLGLPKTATPDDVMAAVTARQAEAASQADDDEADDGQLPNAHVLEIEARAEEAEWRLQAAFYPGTADAAREFADYARSERDPEALTQKFYELLSRFTEAAGASEGATGDDAVAAAAADDAGPGSVDIGVESESPAADDQEDAAALERLKGSGRVAEGMRHIPGFARLLGG